MPDWDEPSATLRANLVRVARAVRDAARRRVAPDVALAQGWHRDMVDGLDVPDSDWVGRFRGDPKIKSLRRCQVRVGSLCGVEPSEVAGSLQIFVDRFQRALAFLDRQIAVDATPEADSLDAVLRLAGWVHAEWVRIHPFANGSGRTARLWANFVLWRYRLAPIVRLRPRPAQAAYAASARAAMLGDPQPTIDLFRALFYRHLKVERE